MIRSVPAFLVVLLLLSAPARGAETFDEAMARAKQDYGERLRKASEELNLTRTRIAAEKAPFLEQLRAAENRVIAAESESTRLETGQEKSGDRRREALKQLEAVRKNTSYINSIAQESLKALKDGLSPGEDQHWSDEIQRQQQQLDGTSEQPSAEAAVGAVELLLTHTQQALGGYTAPGRSLLANNNELVPGIFAFAGPETYFRPDRGGGAGSVRTREGSKYPTTYVLTQWKPEDATALFRGEIAPVIADASGGKALRLKETSGTVWAHIQKGGLVAFAILGVGALAALMIAQKIRDVVRMSVDSPEIVQEFLSIVVSGSAAEAQRAVTSLKATTRELFTVGLRHLDKPKSILEEHLQAVLLQQRLHFERRLPLLAVIATASPLMGLLGTVVGMVKTFALITVFGTGNAGKLSSGISEVLVATELGLIVAIPTLVAHGFIAHRIHKNLATLERYALKFVTAVETSKIDLGASGEKESITV